MIKTSRQLKALVRNRSGGDNAKAMTLIRSYIMERFLERISLSQYSDKLILKGGLLVASMVGIDNRATMDMDTTVKNYNLSLDDVSKMVEEIISIPIEDGIEFSIKSLERIMDDAEYPGIRLKLEAELDTMKTPLKVDISTDDVITPGEVKYEYRLMFENRSISVSAYNLETVLAEKMETIISRGALNTRMRDFYDLRALSEMKADEINHADLKEALTATSKKRGSYDLVIDAAKILKQIRFDSGLAEQWSKYQRKYEYAMDYDWASVMKYIELLFAQTVEGFTE